LVDAAAVDGAIDKSAGLVAVEGEELGRVAL
jgi:hypothetical protein